MRQNRGLALPGGTAPDHSLRKLHETIKDAVDPNGILSAGRYGIWPKHLRKA
jgi:hypothetical protein